jgi:hypothetical protein
LVLLRKNIPQNRNLKTVAELGVHVRVCGWACVAFYAIMALRFNKRMVRVNFRGASIFCKYRR